MDTTPKHSIEIPVAKLFLIAMVGLFISGGLYWKYRLDIHQAKASYRHAKEAEVAGLQQKIEEKFRYIYQTIRTMSFIPGVRTIDRYGKKFDGDSKMAVQQLYNNAYLNIKLSEIYILPKALDPDVTDPVTGKPEEPITTFDELVLSDRFEEKKEEEKPEMEEVEIYEYRLMKDQLQYLSQNFANRSSFKELNVPVVSGPEVVTCDNSDFTAEDLKNHNDAPRSGLVFTVPVYGYDGLMRGAVSAIIRTKVIRELLPSHSFALANKANKYVVTADSSPHFKKSMQYFENGSSDPNLVFSSLQKVGINDSSPWELWVAFDDSLFWNTQEITNARMVFWGPLATVWLILVLVGYSVTKSHRLNRSMRELVISLLEQSHATKILSENLRVSANRMSEGIHQQSAATQETAASMEQITAMLHQTSANTRQLDSLNQESVVSAEKGDSLISEVVGCANELSTFANDTGSQMSKFLDDLRGITNVITGIGEKTEAIHEIVFQTKLLSFNASVEAARAGEYGKGFSVVAEEVGTLAKSSGDSAQDISKALDQGTRQILEIISENSAVIESFLNRNVQLIGKLKKSAETCKVSFEEINSRISSATQLTKTITQASSEQFRGVEESNKAIALINSSSNENSTQNESVLKSIEQLTDMAQQVDDLVKDISSLMNISLGKLDESEPQSGKPVDDQRLAA